MESNIQYLDSLDECESELFSILDSIERILSFFNQSMKTGIYDNEELPEKILNRISLLGKKLLKITSELPYEVPHASTIDFSSRFSQENIEKILIDFNSKISILVDSTRAKLSEESLKME